MPMLEHLILDVWSIQLIFLITLHILMLVKFLALLMFVEVDGSPIAHRNFDGLRMKQSSTWRELKSVSFALRCFAPNSRNSSVKLYTDNKGVAFITDSGSNKPHLNVIAKDIFCFTSAHDIDMLNQKADYYSKIIDFDNWCVSNAYFREIDSSDEVP